VADILRPGTFIGQRHLLPNSEVWKAIQTAAMQGPVDILTVTSILFLQQEHTRTDHPIHQVGYCVSRFTDRVASSCNLRYHALCIFEFALREQAVAILREEGGKELGDFTELEAYLADETRDIHRDISLCVSYLNANGHPDAAASMHELCENVSHRLKHMARDSWRNYIKDQYRIIIEQERTERNGGNTGE